MDKNIVYKVLWVDDVIFDPVVSKAGKYHIKLDWVSSWSEAKTRLENHFDDYSALILDCYCSLKPNDPENENFLREVFTEFNQIQGKDRILPWYVLSQGNKERFDNLMEHFLSDQRLKWDEKWGKGYYIKSDTSISLEDGNEKPDYIIMLENIERVAKNSVPNKVRAKYPEAFEAARYFGGKIEHDLLNFLVKDYENDLDDTYLYYNCVREIMKFVFDDGKKRRIFPPLSDTNGFGSLLDKGIVIGRNGKGWKIENFETFIPKALGHAISFLLDYANQGSHYMTTDKVTYYVKQTNNISLFRAMLNIEMDLLVWYHDLCKKVDDVNNTDFMPEKLFVRVKEGEPLTNLEVHADYQHGWHYYVKTDDISIELNVDKSTNDPQINEPQIKEGVFVNINKYHPGNKFSDIATHYSKKGEYVILQKNITVYDQDNNELRRDTKVETLHAIVEGTGVNYFGLPQEVKVTPCAGYYIDSIVSESLLSKDLIELNNKYSIATIKIKELIEDLKFIVTIRQCPKLTLNPVPEEGGSVTNNVSLTPGNIVSISAIPNEGYKFVEWQGCEVKDKKSQKTTFTMPTKDVSLVAFFKKKDE